MKKYTKNIVILILLLVFVSCISKEEKIKKLICGDSSKYWVGGISYDFRDSSSYFYLIRYDKEGNCGYYTFRSSTKKLEPVIEDDVIPPNTWELKNDSVILYGRKGSYGTREKKIVKINRDILILSRRDYRGIIRTDTLSSLPDSIQDLLSRNPIEDM